jgi:hypothetical protein
MNKKEIEFYLKFHKGFRKRHTLNSALKSNLLQWGSLTPTLILTSHSAGVSKITKN